MNEEHLLRPWARQWHYSQFMRSCPNTTSHRTPSQHGLVWHLKELVWTGFSPFYTHALSLLDLLAVSACKSEGEEWMELDLWVQPAVTCNKPVVWVRWILEICCGYSQWCKQQTYGMWDCHWCHVFKYAAINNKHTNILNKKTSGNRAVKGYWEECKCSGAYLDLLVQPAMHDRQ
jgi:hypothetical protein